MNPKVSYDVGGFQILTFSNENGEQLHVHVARGKNHSLTLKFWYRNSEWVLDTKQSNLRVTKSEMKMIQNHLSRNRADIVSAIIDFHSNAGSVSAIKPLQFN